MEYTEYELNYAIEYKNIFDSIIGSSVLELESELVNIIKKRWKSGRSVDGGRITNQESGGGYSRLSYKNLKLQINPSAGGNVDLTLTGSLGDNLHTVKLDSGSYEIVSSDSKYMTIGSMYGFDEFGLDEGEMIYFMNKLEVIITNKLNQK